MIEIRKTLTGQPKQHFSGHYNAKLENVHGILRTCTEILRLFKGKWNSPTFQGLRPKIQGLFKSVRALA